MFEELLLKEVISSYINGKKVVDIKAKLQEISNYIKQNVPNNVNTVIFSQYIVNNIEEIYDKLDTYRYANNRNIYHIMQYLFNSSDSDYHKEIGYRLRYDYQRADFVPDYYEVYIDNSVKRLRKY